MQRTVPSASRVPFDSPWLAAAQANTAVQPTAFAQGQNAAIPDIINLILSVSGASFGFAFMRMHDDMAEHSCW